MSAGYTVAESVMDVGEQYLSNNVENGIKAVSSCELTTILNILLDGDYSEVGTIICAVKDGEKLTYGTFNYIFAGGLYCITDPLDYLSCETEPIMRVNTMMIDDLANFEYALEKKCDKITEIVTVAVYPLMRDDISCSVSDGRDSVVFTNLDGVRYLKGGT